MLFKIMPQIGTGCEENTTKNYYILTSISTERKDKYLACLLHDEDNKKYEDSLVADAVCVNISQVIPGSRPFLFAKRIKPLFDFKFFSSWKF